MPERPDLAWLSNSLPAGAGALGLLSSDEFLPGVAAFDRALLALAPGPRVGLVLCADHRAAPNSAHLARAHLAGLGAEVVSDDLIHDPDSPEVDLIYLAGGSPAALLEHLEREAEAWRRQARAWEGGAALAGSSAGAMVLCEHTLVPRPGDRVPTTWTRGLGIVKGVGLAVHASSRPPDWIEEAATRAPAPVLALDDETGVLVRNGHAPQVIGPGDVWLAQAT